MLVMKRLKLTGFAVFAALVTSLLPMNVPAASAAGITLSKATAMTPNSAIGLSVTLSAVHANSEANITTYKWAVTGTGCSLSSTSTSTNSVTLTKTAYGTCDVGVDFQTSVAGYSNSGPSTKYTVTLASSYTVTYDANGGTVSPTSQSYTGTALTTPTPTLAGSIFTGWYDAASGGNRIKGGGESYTPTGTTTLHAQWRVPGQYTVTYNANTGSVTPTSAVYTEGGSALTLPTPTKSGKTFVGWFTSGGLHVTSPYTPSADITLTAQWAEVTIDVQYLNNFKNDHYYTDDQTTTLQALPNYVGSGTYTYHFVLTGHNSGGDPKCEPFSETVPNSTNGYISYTITNDPRSGALKVGRGCDMKVELYIDGVLAATSGIYHIYYGPNPYAKTPSVTATGHNGIVDGDFDDITPTPTNFACQEGGYTGDFTYTINPSLPAGLSMDPDTGVISGTPTEESPRTLYTITAACGDQEATTDIYIRIGDPQVDADAEDGTVGSEFPLNEPDTTNFACQAIGYSGPGVWSFTIDDEADLPRGLSFDATTGKISGVPTETMEETSFTITATCDDESVSDDISFKVVSDPQLSVDDPNDGEGNADDPIDPIDIDPNNYVCQYDDPFDVETDFTFTISPDLPRGLDINFVDGEPGHWVISGTPTEATDNITYTITGECGSEEQTVDFDFQVFGLDQTVVFAGDNFVFGTGSWDRMVEATATSDPIDGAPDIWYTIDAGHADTTAEGCAINQRLDGTWVLSYTTGGSCWVIAHADPVGRYNGAESDPMEFRAWVEGDLTEEVLNPQGLTLVTGSGFTPGGLVQLELHSIVYQLGTTIADENGFVYQWVRMPAGAPLGDHHIWMIDLDGSETYNGQTGFYIVKLPVKIVAGLASTGTDDVFGPILGGTAAFLTGIALVLVRRRRRQQA